MLADVLTGLFGPDQATGQRGAAAVAGRNPDAADDLIYVTSRTEDRVQMLTVYREPTGWVGSPVRSTASSSRSASRATSDRSTRT
jgi:hypothetical protein